jgi:PPP family 3-phenylpropionic acid transporter
MHALPYWRLSGYYFFYFAFIGAFSPYFGLYLQSLSFSAWDIGLLMSQMQLMRLFAPYLWGALADRLAQRVAVVRLAGLLSLLGFSTFFVVSGFVPMLMAMALLAFFWSAALPLVETLTFDHLRAEPARYSRIRLWGSIGFIAAVMGTGALLDSVPLPGLLWVIVGTLGGILVYAWAVPEALPSESAEAHLPVATIIRQARVRALFAACFAMSAAHGALYVFYSIHLSDHHYSKFLVGCLWSLGVVAEIVVFFFMAGLLRRFGLRTLLLVSFSAAVLWDACPSGGRRHGADLHRSRHLVHEVTSPQAFEGSSSPGASPGASARSSPPPTTTRPPTTGTGASRTRCRACRSRRSTPTSATSARWPTSRSGTRARASCTSSARRRARRCPA